MSAVTKVSLVINRGATFRQKFAWKDSKGKAIDLTGFTARMHIRPDVNSTTVLADLNTSNGGITLTPKLGLVALYLSDTVTTNLAVLRAVYDIELVSPSGDVYRLVNGDITITPEVTRA